MQRYFTGAYTHIHTHMHTYVVGIMKYDRKHHTYNKQKSPYKKAQGISDCTKAVLLVTLKPIRNTQSEQPPPHCDSNFYKQKGIISSIIDTCMFFSFPE